MPDNALTRCVFLCALLAAAGPLRAGEVRYLASEHESVWSLQSSRLACTLSQKVPLYGTASFSAGVGRPLGFSLPVNYRLPRTAEVAFSSLPPPWKHNAVGRVLGSVPFPKDGVLRAVRPLADTLLSELEQGMSPTASYQDISGDKVQVGLSPVNIHPALNGFVACLKGILPFGFDAVRQSVIRFGHASTELSAAARGELDRVAEYLLADKTVREVRIASYTDSRGFRRYNRRLSQHRAEAIRKYLAGKGLAKVHFVIHAYGEARPVASNRSSKGRSLNRRAVVTLAR